jgi:ADP-ribose pyrophosphatase
VVPVLDDPLADDPTVLLIRQYRYAAGGYLLEVPAGRPDQPGEDWEVCARRELQEETGLTAGTMTYLTTIFTTPGFTDEQIWLYMALDLTPVAGGPALEADEVMEIERIPLAEAISMAASGAITDAKTVASLLRAAAVLEVGEPAIR